MKFTGYNEFNCSLAVPTGNIYLQAYSCKEQAVRHSHYKGVPLYFLHPNTDKVKAKMEEYFTLIGKNLKLKKVPIDNLKYDALALVGRTSQFDRELAAIIFRAIQRMPQLLDEPATFSRVTRVNYLRSQYTKLVFKNLPLFKKVALKNELKRCFNGGHNQNGFVDWTTKGHLNGSIEKLKKEIEKQKLTAAQNKANIVAAKKTQKKKQDAQRN